MRCVLVCCVLLFPLFRLAATPVSLEVQAANTCLEAIHKAEATYRIPPRLLESIALVESGRSLGKTSVYPWPWTVTVNGKGHYFPTKAAAIAAVTQFQARGHKNIDVGCMQVNLQYHPKAFRSLQDAFDITQNVAYAAKFLRELKEQHVSWQKAIGCYHSATSSLHTPYKHRVLKQWAEARTRSAFPFVDQRQPQPIFAATGAHRSRSSPSRVSSPMPRSISRQRSCRSGKPMSVFYANLNRRTSGKIYQASLCKGYSTHRYSL
jgi:hypothetical protein